MDRRTFLRRSGIAALGASLLPLIESCTRAHSSSTSVARSPAPTAGGSTVATPADWRSLAESLDGVVYRPSSTGYVVASQLFDPRFDGSHPQAVVRCTSSSDVQRSIAFARAHEILIAPRCGGHSYGGYSSGPGIVIDVSGLSSVRLSPGSVRVGGGARLIDLSAAIGPANVAVPGGTCPTVGIAGLTLGGGQGVIGRKFGLTCDMLTEVEMVTADGTLRRCSTRQEPDLFWASQGGGGGNFGIATAFTFRTAPIGQVVVFTLDWPWDAAAEVVDGWQRSGPAAPDELWSDCHLVYRSGGGPTVSVNGVFVGEAADLSPHLTALTRVIGSDPSATYVTPMTYASAMLFEAGCTGLTTAQCHLPSQDPAGTLTRESNIVTSDFYDTAVPSDGVQAMVDAVGARADDAALRRSTGGILLDAFGGAINRVPADATAFVHRSSRFLAQGFATLPTGTDSTVMADNERWLRAFWRSMRPWASGYAYQNYIDPNLRDWQHAYYGTNLPRLVEVKTAYDPDDVFHFAQSIPTS
ncbi:MAG: FAD-binding oxidoreductase [Actinomycetota bacterium]